MKIFLREFLAMRGRSFALQLLIVTIAAGAGMASLGRLHLITGLAAGYLLAGICAWTMIYRTWKASSLNVRRAKVQMWLGMLMRFAVVFILLYAALKRSDELFLAAAGGFIAAFALYMVNLCIFAYYKNMG